MDKEHKSIERIKMASDMSLAHYGQPLILTYSGGKDSDVTLELFKRSGCPFKVVNFHTTIDAPPTVYHVRDEFRKCREAGIEAEVMMPQYKGKPTTMWKLIEESLMPPTRVARYCCTVLKERTLSDCYIATGVRWAESKNRQDMWDEFNAPALKRKQNTERFNQIMLNNDNDARRRMTELCQTKHKMVVNPIIDWEDQDIYDFIESEHLDINPLYKDYGYTRASCLGCPVASKYKRIQEFRDFPKYKAAYIRAFGHMIENRRAKGKPTEWQTGRDVFNWWMDTGDVVGQMEWEDLGIMP